jgi:SAM-dependent methyltransferase
MPRPQYLEPYLIAADQFGAGFGTLLWASPKTQATRFAAIARACDLGGKAILDVGCGRADFLEFLKKKRIQPASYAGIEAVEPLALAAESRGIKIIRGDFVTNPTLLDQSADVIVFSGSLNTLHPLQFLKTLKLAWEYTRGQLAFNFLNSPRLAGKKYLSWYKLEDLLKFGEMLCDDVRFDNEYIEGDCLIVMRK